MQLSPLQRIVIVAGLLALASAFIYVPFEASYVRKGDDYHASIGYDFIWNRPNAVKTCVTTFGMPVNTWDTRQSIIQNANRHCHSKPALPQILITAGAISTLTLALFLVVGTRRRRA